MSIWKAVAELRMMGNAETSVPPFETITPELVPETDQGDVVVIVCPDWITNLTPEVKLAGEGPVPS